MLKQHEQQSEIVTLAETDPYLDLPTLHQEIIKIIQQAQEHSEGVHFNEISSVLEDVYASAEEIRYANTTLRPQYVYFFFLAGLSKL